MTRGYWRLSVIASSFALSLVWVDENTFPSLAQAQVDDDPALRISPSTTNKTVPDTPYEQPGKSLIGQEEASRNSPASQEVNKNLNNEFANYSEPIAAVAWITAIVASLLLVAKAAWFGIPLASAFASVIARGFFRWPRTPLEWINKLAIYIGLADFGLRLAT